MRRFVRVVLVVGAVLGSYLVVGELSDPQRRFRESGKYTMFELEGQSAPGFEAKVVGADATFGRGDVALPTLFVFFGTFCPHCKEQMPAVGVLAREFEGRANVFAVNAREYATLPMEEREERVVAYLAEQGWGGMPTLLAPVEMQSALRVEAVPTVMLLDGSGRVRYVGLANHSEADLREKLGGVL